MKSTDFVVARNDLQQCKFIEMQLADAAALPEEALLIKIDRFAFTANNITYAVLGGQPKANAVLNKIVVAKRSSSKAKIAAAKPPGSKQ